MNEPIEQLIERNAPKSAVFVKGGMVGLSILIVLYTILTLDMYMLIAAVALVFITVLLFRYYDMEYEYLWFNNELTIDRITGKSSRKKEATFDFGRLEAMAPVGHRELERLNNSGYKVMDYSSRNDENLVYSAFVMHRNEMVNLKFEPNEKMVKAIKYIHPRNVFEEEYFN